MTNNLPKGVLFDLDGVLVDTESQYSIFWGKMGIEYNTGIPDFAERIKGSNLPTILNTYFPDKQMQDEIVEKLNRFQEAMTYEICPGVEQFICQLKQNNIPMCIVTSSDDKKMEQLFEHQPYFRDNFTNIITGDQVTNSKPHPECFLKGASKIGVDIKDCVIFEDSMQGITAGLASGAKVIALSTTCSVEQIGTLTKVIIPSFENFSLEQIGHLFNQ
ncbi:MAG: HAD family hydrolase [Muribaculaceae bacterium]